MSIDAPRSATPVRDTAAAPLPELADVVIVGAGVAGGIMAERLSAAGRACLVLEAGKRWNAAQFPVPPLLQGQLFWKQGMEFTSDGRMIVLRGKCVGGSSVVNQALLDMPGAAALGRWVDASGVGWLADGTLSRRLSALLESGRFRHQVLPASANNGNAQRFLDGMRAEGWDARQLRRAQADCRWSEGQNCMDCLGGCPRRSKQSALETSLPRAEAHGAQIVAGVTVNHVNETADGVLITVETGGQRQMIRANALVLAAGSVGTTQILLRSGLKTILPAVGEGFHIHPQFNTFARFDTPVDGHLGALQSVASDDPRFEAEGFKLECVALPDAVMSATLPWAGAARGQLPDYRNWACAEVSIRDAEPGRIRLGTFGGYRLEKSMSLADMAKRTRAREILAGVFRSVGAREVVHGWISWSVHPMGGASLGHVVAPDFKLIGSRRITVADASLFPTALGHNPSLTVMGLADLAADAWLAEASVAEAGSADSWVMRAEPNGSAPDDSWVSSFEAPGA